jgi:tetratricopeptide (TPR) repeat protein
MAESDPNKTVFISYRRDVSAFIARAVFMDLRANGYDVFMDVESIDSGTFDTVILNQIAARAHFVLILTPGSVERCIETDDWLRREIETAIDLGRNIVPLLFNNFVFKGAEQYLTGKLENLSRYNALNVPHDFFEAAMDKLHARYLKVPSKASLSPVPHAEQQVVEQKIEDAAANPLPTPTEIEAEEFVVDGFSKYKRGNYKGAIEDYDQAIRLNPNYILAYNFRSAAHAATDNFEAAIQDCNAAIELKPNGPSAYSNLGDIYFAIAQYDKALTNFQRANTIKPNYAPIMAGIAITHHALGQVELAKRLWTSLIQEDERYWNIDWVSDMLNWAEPLAEEARKVIAKLE